MYWADEGDSAIRRSNLDGSDVEDVVVGAGYPMDLALDLAGGKVYWSSRFSGKVRRANLDGSEVEDVVTGILESLGVALDLREPAPVASGAGVAWLAALLVILGTLAIIARRRRDDNPDA